MLVGGHVHAAFEGGSGAFQHGHTFVGHPVACAGALATQKIVRREKLVEKVHAEERLVRALLEERFGQHPHVGDIRGRGFFFALELVADRESKAPFAPERQLAARIKREAQARGLLCYPGAGTVDGEAGDHVLLAPPYTATGAELAEMVRLLGESLDALLA